MSLAAKSGQMQVFNSIISQNLNQDQQCLGRNSNINAPSIINQSLYIEDIALNGNRKVHSRKQQQSFDQDQFESIQSSNKLNQFQPSKKNDAHSNLSNIQGQIKKTLMKQTLQVQHSSQSQKPPVYSLNLQLNQKFINNQRNAVEPILKINGNSFSGQPFNQFQNKNLTLDAYEKNNQISEPFKEMNIIGFKNNQTEFINDENSQNLKKQQTQKQNETTNLGAKQFENYLQRKQIIQQQRDKKKELLKQLDMGITNRGNKQDIQKFSERLGEQINENTAYSFSKDLEQKMIQCLRIDGYSQNNFNKQNPIFANSEYNNILPNNQNEKLFVQHHMHSQIGNAQFTASRISPTRGSKQLMHQHHLQPPYNNFSIQGSSTHNRTSLSNQENTENFGLQSDQARFKKSNIENYNDFKNNPNNSFQLPDENFAKNIFATNAQTLQLINQPVINKQHSFDQQIINSKLNNGDINKSYDRNSFNSLNNNEQILNSQLNNSFKDNQNIIQDSIIAENKQEDQMMENQNSINRKITRKFDGGRPHKIYDYMFIQMSNEQFIKDYASKTIIIQSNEQNNQNKSPSALQISQLANSKINELNISNFSNRKLNFLSPNKSPILNQKINGLGQLLSPQYNTANSVGQDHIDLNGIVKIKAYESVFTNELPPVQCNLQATQLDHLKVLICEQEDRNHPKLAQEALTRFENLKQNQIKQYMDDIIKKLQQKDRKFKITVKKKFIDDALYNSTQIRVASVYVIVINRDKIFDSNLEKQKHKKRIKNKKQLLESSSDENDLIDQLDPIRKEEYLRMQRLKESMLRRESSLNNQKRSMYDSDSNEPGIFTDMNVTCKSSGKHNKLVIDKSMSLNNIGGSFIAKDGKLQKNKKAVQNIQQAKKNVGKSKDDEQIIGYKYNFPAKEYPTKYGPTKIKIIQDLTAHAHHQKHPVNIFFYQYNEFIKLVLKNQKLQNQTQSTSTGPAYKFNHIYAMGLAKALGMNLKKDAFSEANMKLREHVNMLKEKLIFCFWKKLNDSNKDLTPHLNPQNKDFNDKFSAQTSTNEELNGETIDSLSNQNNTPRSKNMKKDFQFDQAINDLNKAVSTTRANNISLHHNQMLPPLNIIYKYFIGKGNNSIMVRSLFKNRFWWVQHDKEEMEKCNFCWTQIKKPNLMEALPCKYPFMKSGIKNVNYNNATSQIIQQIQETPQQKSNKKKRMDSQNSDRAHSQNTGYQNLNQINQNTQQQNPQIDIIQKWTEQKLYNKIEDNFNLNNKKALYINMKNYYEALGQNVFDNLPLTFHIKIGLDDPEFHKFKQYYFKNEEEIKTKRLLQKLKKKEQAEMKEKLLQKNDGEQEQYSSKNSPENKNSDDIQQQKEQLYYQSPAPPKNIWIIKPGENTNRGHGIQVAKEFDEIKAIISESTTQGKRTCIVQKYIHNPLLINRRKFDIRTYVLMTSINGNTKVYIYEEGYLRTSSREYSVQNLSNKLVHLTNDAVQKRAEEYGKFEPGNKLSYNEFQIILDKNYNDLNICFDRDIKSQMNKITTDIFRAVYTKLDPKRRLHCMEVFGLDFMIDDEFKPYLIEVNTNPCLELACPLLARLIPNMIENALKIGLDALFMPPEFFSTKKAFIGDACPENRFELVFDCIIDGPTLDQLFKNKENMIVEMDEDELSEEEEHDDDE